jgi:osomolarity two-component system response regulator SSK1
VLTRIDNPINQNILSMFLRKKKIKHQSAKDGLEAVEKWRTGGFHLILVSDSHLL